MGRFFLWFQKLLEHPVKIAFLAVLTAFCSLLIGGTFYDLWNISREKMKIKSHLEQTKYENLNLQSKIKQAKNSDKFIGHQARERLDLVKEDELVFIFENDAIFETPSTQRQVSP